MVVLLERAITHSQLSRHKCTKIFASSLHLLVKSSLKEVTVHSKRTPPPMDKLLLNVRQLKAVALLLVSSLEEYSRDESYDTKGSKDKHSLEVVLRLSRSYILIVCIEDSSDEHRHSHESDVLNPEDS